MTSAFLLLRRAGISNDDVTISRWIRRSAKEKLLTDEKNKGEVEVAFSSKLQYIQSQATVQPVESYSGLFNQPLEINVSVLAAPPSSPSAAAAARRAPPPPARCRRKFVSGQLDEENPFVLISSALLVIGKQNHDSAAGPPPCTAAHPLKRTNARDSRNGSATQASSGAIAALLIGLDLHALSHVASAHVARGAPPRRTLAVQLETGGAAPLRARWPIASIATAQSVAHEVRAKKAPLHAWHRPLVEHVRHTMAHVGRAMRDCAALVARKIVDGGRRPAAAPAMLRRRFDDVWVYVDATRIHGPAHIIEGVMYAGKLSTPLTTVVSRSELPLTLAHIIGDVKGTVLHDSTLMGRLDTITAYKMVSMKNPLAVILDSNRFTGLNYQDWLRNLNLVLASEKLLYTIEKSPPKETPANISPEELITLNQWRDDEVKTRCYVMASMSNGFIGKIRFYYKIRFRN
ncbi:hypothetical protein F511_35899 [Dorcoceras hygrometricum]|uniref:Uncharacterized protein n=1 Tax=Dorcoceras hygrometricum TaxID=472368 RepID=A0A2Z7BNX5_9LAMI|nr:hypothetical protein F511_35899 [Dorcoceras hygrometricum]